MQIHTGRLRTRLAAGVVAAAVVATPVDPVSWAARTYLGAEDMFVG